MLLDGNALASLEGIGVFRALHTLSCASNQLHDATPTGCLERLRVLRMRSNDLDDAGIARLPTGLAELDLAENRLSQLRTLLHTLRDGGERLRQLRLLPGNTWDVDIGLGVVVTAVVVWGFDDLDPKVVSAYRANVQRALPWLAELDGEVLSSPVQPPQPHQTSTWTVERFTERSALETA